MIKSCEDLEQALEQLAFGYDLMLYSFTLEEITELLARIKEIRSHMISEGLAGLPELLDD